MIHVVATIRVRSGGREAFLTEFREVVPLVRNEQGCLEYGAAIDTNTDIAAQPPLRPDVVVVVEKWRDKQALAAHLAADHMQTYRQRVRDLVENVEIQVLEPVD